jgi:hypothetical protein
MAIIARFHRSEDLIALLIEVVIGIDGNSARTPKSAHDVLRCRDELVGQSSMADNNNADHSATGMQP